MVPGTQRGDLMKKNTKKLVLNRETLASLERGLAQVVGGITNNPDVCFSGQRTCATCVATCTTNRC